MRISTASRSAVLTFLFASILNACTGDSTADVIAPHDSATDASAHDGSMDAADTIALDANDDTAIDANASDTTVVDANTDVGTDAMDSGHDVATDASACGATGVAPDLDGPNTCSTLDFGQPAAMVQTVANPISFTGGTIPPGIYDIVSYQRTTGTIMTTIRATLVISSDGRFTEVRVLDTGNGTPPTTRKSGNYHTSGTTLVRDVMCGGSDGGFETNQLQYSVECTNGQTLLQMGLTNLWFTYRLR